MVIKWLFNNKPIFGHLGISTTKFGERSNFMTVPSVTDKNNGTYTCLASNAAGSANFSSTLYVHGILVYIYLFESFIYWTFFVVSSSKNSETNFIKILGVPYCFQSLWSVSSPNLIDFSFLIVLMSWLEFEIYLGPIGFYQLDF